jgi:CopG family transcriptional regulator / antitoxin EndoAI
MRTTQTWTVSLPPNLVREAERTAKEEDRTKSELVREALRMYIEERRWRKLQRETAARAQALGLQGEEDVVRLVRAGRK